MTFGEADPNAGQTITITRGGLRDRALEAADAYAQARANTSRHWSGSG